MQIFWCWSIWTAHYPPKRKCCYGCDVLCGESLSLNCTWPCTLIVHWVNQIYLYYPSLWGYMWIWVTQKSTCVCVSVISKIAGNRHDLSAGEGHIPCSSNSSIISLVKLGKWGRWVCEEHRLGSFIAIHMPALLAESSPAGLSLPFNWKPSSSQDLLYLLCLGLSVWGSQW